MVRTKDGDGMNSNLIVSEVQKRPCLYDSNHPNYGDRTEKTRCWEEVCEIVVPGWSAFKLQSDKFAAGKEVQKRWRSIRDSYTKAYRQGKCVPDQCPPGSRRYQYHKQMSFLLRALQNKKPRYSQDRYESFSEVSNSPQHPPPEEIPKIKNEIIDKPLDLKTKPDIERPETQDKCNQAKIDKEPKTSLDVRTDNSVASSILPEDHFDDDKLFMNSLLPFFKKMDDDTRLLCRVEVLKIIRYALQGNKVFDSMRVADDRYFQSRMNTILAKEEVIDAVNKTESGLSMTTRSADGSRPIRKRKARSPSPLPSPPKRRGPGRPRKIRPPPSDSEEEQISKKRSPKLKLPPLEVPSLDMDESLTHATSVDQLSAQSFMKFYNLARSSPEQQRAVMLTVKTEPVDT